MAAVQLLASFGRIGLLSMGGGNAMTQLISSEVVAGRGWLSAEEFASMFGLCFLFPGITQVKLAAMIGMTVGGGAGAAAAVAGLTGPGLILSTGTWRVLQAYRGEALVAKLLLAMSYGAVAMLAAALCQLVSSLAAGDSAAWTPAALAVGLFAAVLGGMPSFYAMAAYIVVSLIVL